METQKTKTNIERFEVLSPKFVQSIQASFELCKSYEER